MFKTTSRRCKQDELIARQNKLLQHTHLLMKPTEFKVVVALSNDLHQILLAFILGGRVVLSLSANC